MNRRYACLVVGCALALGTAGCGTYSNVMGSDAHLVYGGVRRDQAILRDCNGEAADRDPDRAEHVMPFVSNMAAMTACMDMPVSFVGDTLTLPYTLCCAILRGGQEEQPRPSVRASASDARH